MTEKNQNLSTLRAIGSGVRKTEEVAAAIVAGLPEGFDSKARGAVSGAVHAWAGFPEGTDRPAVKSGKAGAQTLTDYGRGVDAVAKAVSRLLKGKADNGPVLRVSLSGEGGGSATVPSDSPLYAILSALATADEIGYAKALKALQTPKAPKAPKAGKAAA